MTPVMGSSPLARGLQDRGDRSRRQRRIIPARAGFTQESPRKQIEGPDHPRSRGVYLGPFTAADESSGSSPLARGLLRVYV